MAGNPTVVTSQRCNGDVLFLYRYVSLSLHACSLSLALSAHPLKFDLSGTKGLSQPLVTRSNVLHTGSLNAAPVMDALQGVGQGDQQCADGQAAGKRRREGQSQQEESNGQQHKSARLDVEVIELLDTEDEDDDQHQLHARASTTSTRCRGREAASCSSQLCLCPSSRRGV